MKGMPDHPAAILDLMVDGQVVAEGKAVDCLKAVQAAPSLETIAH